jgi:hypothetical protein
LFKIETFFFGIISLSFYEDFHFFSGEGVLAHPVCSLRTTEGIFVIHLADSCLDVDVEFYFIFIFFFMVFDGFLYLFLHNAGASVELSWICLQFRIAFLNRIL